MEVKDQNGKPTENNVNTSFQNNNFYLSNNTGIDMIWTRNLFNATKLRRGQ